MKQLFLFLTVVLMAGCAQPSKKFYVLTSQGPSPSGSGVGIGVGPVALAEYLDRPNLVTQESANQLSVSEDHRWAGDLSESIARVSAANLGRLVKSGNVRVYPWQRDDEVDYQVTLDVRQLHSTQDGYAVIEAGWRVYAFPERRLKASRTFVDREPLESDGYDSMVAAQSRLMARLAQDISSSIR
jgi:uncharacterized protein